MSDEQPPAERIVPEPTAHEIVLSPLDRIVLEEYIKFSELLNFSPQALLRKKMLAFLKDKGVKIYRFGDMFDFLRQEAVKNNSKFIWRPFRPKDHLPNNYFMEESKGHGGYKKDDAHEPFGQIVPWSALALVKSIIDSFGDDKVYFLVSDYKAPNPHHFMIFVFAAPNLSSIVFDHWIGNEPTFGP